ncbi:MAG: ACT domain-containing protein [Proteiniphilum sp.]|nr:ACT domain-containing protein [Proteiniphilum sp.]MDD3908981.1 ACT domain-containing protein [Proteiniphilum sp.]MDD4416275.1 ACT domain-containing protein [Proteiniphilum sp.]
MLIQQLSVFLEDRSGRLTELTRILAENDVNITALSVAETADYGIVRLVVGRPETAREVLEKAGFSIGLTDVVCVNMPDQPGSLYQILKILTKANINIDYMYAFSNRDVALAVIRAADIEQVINVLHSNSLTLLSQSDIYQL